MAAAQALRPPPVSAVVQAAARLQESRWHCLQISDVVVCSVDDEGTICDGGGFVAESVSFKFEPACKILHGQVLI